MAQTPYERLILSLTKTHGLDPTIVQALSAWLAGRELSDPRAIAYLRNFYPDLAQAGSDAPATNAQRPGKVAAAAPATTLPGATTQPPLAPQAPAQSSAPGTPRDTRTNDIPEGDFSAAAGAFTQWNQQRQQAQPNPVPNPSQAPTQQQPQASGGAPVSAAIPGRGNLSFDQAAGIGPEGSGDFRMKQVLRRLGVDPMNGSLRGQYLQRVLQPLVDARAQFLGYEDGGAGDDGTGWLDDLVNFAQGFTTAGRNGAAEARQFAGSIANGSAFQDVLQNAGDDKKRQQLLQNLQPLLFAGVNPAIANARQHQTAQLFSDFEDAALGFGPDGSPNATPFSGIFTDYLNQNDQNKTLASILFGLGRR